MGWRTIYHANGRQKKAGVAILLSDNLDFKLKVVTRDEEGHYIIITGSIHQEELTIIHQEELCTEFRSIQIYITIT